MCEWNMLLLSALYLLLCFGPVWYGPWYYSFTLVVECNVESDGHGLRVAKPSKLPRKYLSCVGILISSHTRILGKHKYLLIPNSHSRGSGRYRSSYRWSLKPLSSTFPDPQAHKKCPSQTENWTGWVLDLNK